MVLAALLNVSASFMNGGAGTGAVDFFHGFQVALMLTVMSNLAQFVYWRCKASRRGSCWQVHGPTFLTLIAGVLVNIQPMAILVTGSWKLCCGKCVEIIAGAASTCTSTGRTFPPWADGAPRECSINGNLFWDQSFCTGKRIPIFPTKASGWAIQILCTWGGFVFMFIGVLQATQLHTKFRRRWREIRAGGR